MGWCDNEVKKKCSCTYIYTSLWHSTEVEWEGICNESFASLLCQPLSCNKFLVDIPAWPAIFALSRSLPCPSPLPPYSSSPPLLLAPSLPIPPTPQPPPPPPPPRPSLSLSLVLTPLLARPTNLTSSTLDPACRQPYLTLPHLTSHNLHFAISLFALSFVPLSSFPYFPTLSQPLCSLHNISTSSISFPPIYLSLFLFLFSSSLHLMRRSLFGLPTPPYPATLYFRDISIACR